MYPWNNDLFSLKRPENTEIPTQTHDLVLLGDGGSEATHMTYKRSPNERTDCLNFRLIECCDTQWDLEWEKKKIILRYKF